MKVKILQVLLVLALVTSFVTATTSPTIPRRGTGGNIGPCTWFVSLDGTTPVAEAMMQTTVSGTTYNPGDNYVGTAGQSLATYMNVLLSANEEFCFGKGSFDFQTGLSPPASLPITIAQVGMLIPNNVTITGQGVATIFTTSNPVSSSGCSVCDYFVMFMNADTSTNDAYITITNIAINLPAPTQTGSGLNRWDDSGVFFGAHDSTIMSTSSLNGNWQFYPNTANVNTATALTSGQNNDNLLQNNVIWSETGSSNFDQGVNDRALFNTFKKCWDDCFLMGSAGQNILFQGNYVDNTPVVDGKGASGGIIRINNDNAVSKTSMNNITITQNFLFNNFLGSGGRMGINAAGTNVLIISNNDIFNNTGYGIQVSHSNTTIITSNRIYKNGNSGVQIIADVTATEYNTVVSSNIIYDNTNNGIDFSSQSTNQNLQDVVAGSNIIFDDQGSPTQTNGIRFGLSGTITKVTIIGNDLSRSPGGGSKIAMQGGFATSTRIQQNSGYNPVGKVTNFATTGTVEFAPWGSAAGVVASTDYVCDGVPFYFTSSSGTGVSITIKDNLGNTVYAPGAALSVPFYVPIGYKVNFGGFSVAPSVVVQFE